MLRAPNDPTNPVAPTPAPTGDKWVDRITLPEGVSRQQLMAWLKTPAGQQWLESSKKTNITTTQGWGPAGSTLHQVAAPADQIRDWVSRSGWSPLDEPDQPTLMDMGPDYAKQWEALWRQFRQQYPTWTRDQLRKAVHQTIMQNLGKGQREFEERFGDPKPPPPPTTPEDQLRQLIGEARQKMDFELKKQREMDKLRMEFGQKRDSQQQDQEVLNSGRKWRWTGSNYVYDDTPEAQARREEGKRKVLQDQIENNQRNEQRRQQLFKKPIAPGPGYAPKAPHPDFEPTGTISGQVITPWYNPQTGETVSMPSGGYRPKSGTPWTQNVKPGQAQPVQPPAQGTPYGFVDNNGDGIDDNDQLGPSYAPIAPLPPGMRPNPIGGKGNMAPIGPMGERWMF